jgi:hypothetical protein
MVSPITIASAERWMLRQIADIRAPDVGLGDHCEHAFGRQRRLDVDRLDVGAGVRRAHEAGVGLAGQRRVGHEAAVAAQQIVVLDANVARMALSRLGIHVGWGFPRMAGLA